MLAEFTAALNSIRTMSELIKGSNELKTNPALSVLKVELNGMILDIQKNLSSMQERYDELVSEKNDIETKLNEQKRISAEKEKYKLIEVSSGFFVYALKDEKETDGETPWVCQKCLDINNMISIYQYSSTNDYGTFYVCPSCKNKIRTPIQRRSR